MRRGRRKRAPWNSSSIDLLWPLMFGMVGTTVGFATSGSFIFPVVSSLAMEVEARNAELEEKVRQVEAESQIWFNVAKNNKAITASLRATLEQVLLWNVIDCGGGRAKEGYSDIDGAPFLVDDAQSCYFDEAPTMTVAEAALGMRERGREGRRRRGSARVGGFEQRVGSIGRKGSREGEREYEERFWRGLQGIRRGKGERGVFTCCLENWGVDGGDEGDIGGLNRRREEGGAPLSKFFFFFCFIFFLLLLFGFMR